MRVLLTASLLLALVQTAQAFTNLPLIPSPFIDYWELYPDQLLVPLTGNQAALATIAMVYIMALGTLGHLPVNLADLASVIDRKLGKSKKKKMTPYQRRVLSRRRGWLPERGHNYLRQSRQHPYRGHRGRRAADYLVKDLELLDQDNCVLRLICEVEYLTARGDTAACLEEQLVHTLFRWEGVRGRAGALGAAADLGRTAGGRAAPSSPCGQVSPGCPLTSPLAALRRTINSNDETETGRWRHKARQWLLASLQQHLGTTDNKVGS